MFLTVSQAAEQSQRHPDTIRTALRTGELHGSQRIKRGSWRIEDIALAAWQRGETLAVAA